MERSSGEAAEVPARARSAAASMVRSLDGMGEVNERRVGLLSLLCSDADAVGGATMERGARRVCRGVLGCAEVRERVTK